MSGQLSFDIRTEEELPLIAEKLLDYAGSIRVFLFKGEMGSGKTTFIKVLCDILGVKTGLSSPTYSIVNEYMTAFGEKIFHFDLYRLKNTDECRGIGMEEYLHSGCYCFVEWPELAMPLMPETFLLINIIENTNQRHVLFDKAGL